MSKIKKQRKIFIAKFLALVLFFTLYGCSSEIDKLENADQEKENYILLHKNYDYLKSNSALLNKLTNLDTQKSTLKSKNIQTEDFKIFTDKVTYTKRPDNLRESYTFYIEKYNYASNKTIDNLILSRKLGDEKFKAYVISYYFPDGIASGHNNFKVTEFKEINSETFSLTNLTSKSACENTYEYSWVEVKHDCYSGVHSGGAEASLCDGKGSLPYSSYRIVATLTNSCGEGGGGSDPGGEYGTVGGGSGNPGGSGSGIGPGSGNGSGVDTGISLPPSCQSANCDVQILANDINDLLGSTLSYEQLEFLLNNNDKAVAVKSFLDQNSSSEAKIFTQKLIEQMILNPTLQFDIPASFKSPMNIDRLAITNNIPGGEKFNTVYDALTTSPEFKKLFIDVFGSSTRFNVKFEIAEHVYEDNDPAKKEVNATTSQDPVTKSITIKMSKQILIPGTSMSQTKIENAKTVLHECIHAYLFIKANNPSAGADFVKILNTMYPKVNEQHDFMYNQMIPTMQKVLSEIRDSVTTSVGRIEVEKRTMHPTIIPLTSTPWNWNDYYKYVSLKGLDEATCFKVDFPKETDQWNLFTNYIKYGHDDLQP